MTEKELKDSIACPVGGYFFYGDEDYLKEHYTARIREAVIADEELAPFNEFTFDDLTFSPAALEDAISSPPMMTDKKLIRVSLSSYLSVSEKDRERLLELYADLAEYEDTVLVISIAPGGFDGGTEKKPSGELNKISRHMKAVDFPLGQEAKLVRWLGRHFARSGLAADEGALRSMISLCGRSMHRLALEAEKVSARALSMGLGAVDARLVSATVTVTPEEQAFKMVNSILAGDTAGALESLGASKRRNESEVKVLAGITKTFIDLSRVAHMAEEGADRKAIGAYLKSDYRAKLYINACAGIDPERIDKAVTMCAETDVKLKSASLGYIPLERLICAAGALCRKRG